MMRPLVTFVSKYEVERLTPKGRHHLISISDAPDDQAQIDEAVWASVSRHYFIDAGLDEVALEMYAFEGKRFELRYRDYLLEHRAKDLRFRVAEITALGEPIVVNCHAGRSRSAAVARYIANHHGYNLDKPTPDANEFVYRMLARDGSLMLAYQRAVADASEETPPAKVSLVSAIKKLIGI
ncbi:TPA: hypothetical protein VDU83_002685 [Pseudomonas aeruginosa]|nr:hypothetical protein [Pseudomonas aeruginosa]